MPRKAITFSNGKPGRNPTLLSLNSRLLKDPKKKSRGVKRHDEVTSEEVQSFLAMKIEELSALGVPVEDIAKAVGITTRTLYKYYREELDKGRISANASVANELFKRCHAKDKSAVTAQMFWLSRRAGWTDRSTVDHTGKVEVTRVERVIVDPES